MTEGIQTELKIRVIKRHDAGDAEVCADLPHLHSSTWTTVAFQPGNPGSTALGSFTIPLHLPGSEQFAAAKVYYDALARYQRVEASSAGRLLFAGVITGIKKTYGPSAAYELTGASDPQLANMSRPFPGEFLSNDVTSATLKSYLGTNELGASDTFNPFTAGNYTSTNVPGLTAGTWTGATFQGMKAVSCSTGTGAILISKTGAAANDRWHTQFVEAQVWLVESADGTNSGICGVGFSRSSANGNDSVQGFVQACNLSGSGRQALTAVITVDIGGTQTASTLVTNALINTEDPGGYIPLTIGLLITTGGNANSTATASLIVNGKVLIGQFATGYDPGTTTQYPLLKYTVPATGTATTYMTNLVQMTRFTTDGPSTAATFGNGAISTTTNSLNYGADPGPTHLEVWGRLATREGWYWRYTPTPYVVGTRTLGTVDFAADPGADLTNKVIFNRAMGNLVSLEFNNNGDPLAADTALSGQSSLDGGGIGYWRDIGTLSKYGVIQDEALSFTHSDFKSLRQAAFSINANKIALDTLGAKTAVVIRDPQFADTYRELDKITIHDPEMGCNMLACRIMARTFRENDPTETLILDQFSEDFMP